MHNFRKALLCTLALFLLTAMLLCCIILPYFHSTAYYYQDAPVRRSLAGSLDHLVCGSSQALRALEPTVLDEALGWSSYNLATPLMTMRGRYVLLKKELDRNPVNTVIMELSYNAMVIDRIKHGTEGDIYVLGRLDTPAERVSYFLRDVAPASYGSVMMDTLRRGKTAWKQLLTGSQHTPDQWQTRGFSPVPTKDMTFTQEELDKSWLSMDYNADFLDESWTYFLKCMELCRERGVRVIMIVTPVADEMLAQYRNPEMVFDQYRAVAAEYGCDYYDFNLLRDRSERYPAATAFYDKNHLSESGAATFSRQFAEIVAAAEAGEDVSGFFFRDYSTARENLLRTRGLHAPG